jgi:hypothetical protein
MRTVLVAVMLVAIASCGTDRSSRGFYITGTSGSSASGLTLRVVDDPNGAIDVNSSLMRPVVSLVFDVIGEGATVFQFTGAGQIQMRVPVDSSQTTATLFVENVPAARFDRVSLRLVNAQLAIPGDRVPSRDMLGGGPQTVRRTISLDLRSGMRTLVIDLNSAQWLRAVTNPSPGEPRFSFTGPAAFLDAIAMRTQ